MPDETTAPQPQQAYERADPHAESGMGRKSQAPTTPRDSNDRHLEAAGNRPGGRDRPPENPPGSVIPPVPESDIEGDMTTEEPLGWDQAPQDVKDPEKRRHPRPDGVGGSEPDSVEEPHRPA